MELPDCPPGAEGYQDSVVEVPKKPNPNDVNCTKAEQEFQEHLNSLKIKLDNGETRSMVERRGRDIAGKWIYLCFPCGSVCSGESILQTHISGKKHKIKLSMKTSWPTSIFDDHPFNQNQKSGGAASTATEKVLQKMAAAVDLHKAKPSELDLKYNRFREATCHIEHVLDTIKAPLIGVEYLVEFPPDMPHYEPTYMCTLCTKQGHPRTIVNHLTCFWHRYNYLLRHFPKACNKLSPYKNVSKYREGVAVVMLRVSQRIDNKYGRMRPVNIEKDVFEKEKEQILQWLFRGDHFSEKMGATFDEVVDEGLIESLAKAGEQRNEQRTELLRSEPRIEPRKQRRDPSPPVVAAPSKPSYRGRRERRTSLESLSDISDEEARRPSTRRPIAPAERSYNRERERLDAKLDHLHEKYAEQRREIEAFRSKYVREIREKEEKAAPKGREPYKIKLAEEKRMAATEAAAQMLAYHEKNPEKHPLYPEEWKKFWNRRYKEIQAEGKDPAKHDFKPEWIVFWTKRMKELHEEELQTQVTEIYRRMNIPPPDLKRDEMEKRRKSPERRRSPEKRKSPERRRSPVWTAHRSPEPRRRSPDRRSPDRHRPDYRPVKRVYPDPRYSLDRRGQPDARVSPPKRTRSRSPVPKHRSASRTHIVLDSMKRSRSRSPLSQRESELRNRSPLSRRETELRNRSPGQQGREVAPSMQTVMISDDELKADDLSPWNSDNDIESVSSVSRSARAHSHVSSRTRYPTRHHEPQDLGPAENIVATLRVLVALEDYLGSLGPKIVDLLTEALKMEKERANSSEELLERETAVVLIETAKEKLKGAAQAGLVPAAAAPALRAAIVRAAATLHEADTRTRKKQAATKTITPSTTKTTVTKAESVPVAGVGEVDRAQIAQQMAAALIAQGKTDVTSEELAQLVEAVVGMAEAKKREAEAKKAELKPVVEKRSPPAPVKMSGTATALQMLQSAYDENDKKPEKEDAPDAMDGLSDSDLETLLKNFNELSAEEQHSLIAYLKKLEAKEPQRVERLRQYVSAAATSTPPVLEEPPPEKKVEDVKPVTIESDDDDYTVEEVFKSATQKVNEDQIRKELDIVKKSLEETTKEEEDKPAPIIPNPVVEITKQMSSASDIFALVQASIKSTATAATGPNIDVVVSSTQPRSFGDAPQMPVDIQARQDSPVVPVSAPIVNMDMQDTMSLPQSLPNRNYDDNSDSYDQGMQWDQNDMDNMSNSPGPGSNQFSTVTNQFSQNHQFASSSGFDDNSSSGFVPNSGFGSGANSGFSQVSNNFGQGQGSNNFGQGQGSNNFGQGQGSYQYGQGPNQFDQGVRPNQFGPGPNNQFGSGPNPYGQGPNQFSQGPNQAPNNWQGNSGQNRQGPNQYQGNNFGGKNGGMMDNFNNRPQQQFGKNNNFRGRGGGGGRGRGRGRGRF